MSVSLTVSKFLTDTGSDLGVPVSDALSGGGTGIDLGQVVNGAYAPIISQPANTGHQDIYFGHNATVDPITDCKTFIAQFSQTYGGPPASSPAADIAELISQGQSDNELTANNSDGLSNGLRIEHDGRQTANLSLGASAFLPSRAQVKIYGNNGTDGIDLASAFAVHVDAMAYNNAGSEVDAITPQTGKIGKIGDTTLGDRAHVALRFFLDTLAPDGGIIQWDYVFAYSFTA